jgi:hypothetical protein
MPGPGHNQNQDREQQGSTWRLTERTIDLKNVDTLDRPLGFHAGHTQTFLEPGKDKTVTGQK